MIVLHRLGHAHEPFHLNPDLVQTVEARPDTVVTLTTGTRVVVHESPEAVAEAIRAWRASVLTAALRIEGAAAVAARRRSRAGMVVVRGTAGTPPEGSPTPADDPGRSTS